MKKLELRFLLGLHDDIGRACKILNVDRSEFMPNMNRFFDTVSLGIELGIQMKGKPASAAAVIGGKRGKLKPSKDKAKKGGSRAKDGLTMAQRLVKVMGRRTMSLSDIQKALVRAKLAPESKDLRAYINTTLYSSVDQNGKRMFTAPERGFYFVTSKQSAKEVARKTKGKPKTAVKAKSKSASKSKAKGKSKANGKSDKTLVATAEAAN